MSLNSNYSNIQLISEPNFYQEDTEGDSMTEDNENICGEPDNPPCVFYPNKVTFYFNYLISNRPILLSLRKNLNLKVCIFCSVQDPGILVEFTYVTQSMTFRVYRYMRHRGS